MSLTDHPKETGPLIGNFEGPVPAPKGHGFESVEPGRPSWLKAGAWRCGDPFHHSLPQDGKHWERCREMVKKYDESLSDGWKEEIQNLLIVASLLSAVTAAFAVEGQKRLQEDPAATSVLVLMQIAKQLNQTISLPQTSFKPFKIDFSSGYANLLLFLSLALSLATVTLGLLCLQWISEYQRDTTYLSDEKFLEFRQVRHEGLEKWGTLFILSLLPVILQLALITFFFALFSALLDINFFVAFPTLLVLLLTMIVLVVSTFMPAITAQGACLTSRSLQYNCPYKSLQSWLVFKVVVHAVVWIRKGFRINEKRKNINEKYQRLQSCLDWSQFDIVWTSWSRTSREQSLGWVMEMFSENVDNVAAIYHCLREVSVRKAWVSYRYLINDPDLKDETPPPKNDTEYLADLACLAALEHLGTHKPTLGQSHELATHRVELYVRVMNSESVVAVDERTRFPLARSFVPTCPSVFLSRIETDNDISELHEQVIPHDAQMQLLSCILKSFDPSLNDSNRELETIWEILFSTLQDDSLANTTCLAVADDVFSLMERWMSNSNLLTKDVHTRCFKAMQGHFINPFMRSAGSCRLKSMAETMEISSFLKYLGLMVDHRRSFRISLSEQPYANPGEEGDLWEEFMRTFSITDRSPTRGPFFPPPDPSTTMS